ncbi:MAG: hypothetical protein ACI8RZ_007336 [Myxococcota bacterium]|jgi:hypothetical protein
MQRIHVALGSAALDLSLRRANDDSDRFLVIKLATMASQWSESGVTASAIGLGFSRLFYEQLKSPGYIE